MAKKETDINELPDLQVKEKPEKNPKKKPEKNPEKEEEIKLPKIKAPPKLPPKPKKKKKLPEIKPKEKELEEEPEEKPKEKPEEEKPKPKKKKKKKPKHVPKHVPKIGLAISEVKKKEKPKKKEEKEEPEEKPKEKPKPKKKKKKKLKPKPPKPKKKKKRKLKKKLAAPPKIEPKKTKVSKTERQYPSLNILSEHDIAMDFATKAYQKFDKLIKSVILFGSSVKQTSTSGSDVDIIIIIDDSAIQWDQELVAWYREELGDLIRQNPYKKSLHINTVKLTTWWQDLMRGDPVVINVIRYGESLIDFGGFFNPLKVLMQEGKIRSTPEAIYTCLQRAPQHLARSRASELGAVEGIFWAMVDSAHALLIAAKVLPPSPEHIPILLKEKFVDAKLLKMKYVIWYRDLYLLHRKIVHGNITDIKGIELDEWQARADAFIRVMSELIERIIEK